MKISSLKGLVECSTHKIGKNLCERKIIDSIFILFLNLKRIQILLISTIKCPFDVNLLESKIRIYFDGIFIFSVNQWKMTAKIWIWSSYLLFLWRLTLMACLSLTTLAWVWWCPNVDLWKCFWAAHSSMMRGNIFSFTLSWVSLDHPHHNLWGLRIYAVNMKWTPNNFVIHSV